VLVVFVVPVVLAALVQAVHPTGGRSLATEILRTRITCTVADWTIIDLLDDV
jgi:hypothetical protein